MTDLIITMISIEIIVATMIIMMSHSFNGSVTGQTYFKKK